MTDKSIIFFDIDGTLLNHDKELPDSTKEAIIKLKADGHIVAIATGRAPFMYANLRKELGISTYVSYNGQYVVLNNKVSYTNSLNVPSLINLTEIALEKNHPVVFMDHEDMKSNVMDHPYIKESISTLQIYHHPDHDPFYYKGRKLYQSLLFCPEGEEKYYMENFPEFDFVRWHPVAVDVLPKGGSKAIGIEKIIQSLGISDNNVYAFGDGLNDVEMLDSVKNSVAMGNAGNTVKETAKYVTKSVEDDGILHGLKMIGLL